MNGQTHILVCTYTHAHWCSEIPQPCRSHHLPEPASHLTFRSLSCAALRRQVEIAQCARKGILHLTFRSQHLHLPCTLSVQNPCHLQPCRYLVIPPTGTYGPPSTCNTGLAGWMTEVGPCQTSFRQAAKPCVCVLLLR